MQNKELNKLSNPFFIISLLLLIANDFYFKEVFGNSITGKLSDFAGLFALPFFFACLIPRWKKAIHILTVLLFVWWKSSFSQTFIDFINQIGLPISRVIDFSDNIALISVLLSYIILNIKIKYTQLKPLILYPIMGISCFAFIATTIPRRSALEFTEVNKEYEFALPINKFIEQFNDLQIKEINKLSKRTYFEYFYDADAKVFYTKNRDTLTFLIDINNHKQEDTIKFNNYLSDIQIYAKGNDSTILKLVNVTAIENVLYRHQYSYPNYYIRHPNLDSILMQDQIKYKEEAVTRFEKQVIKKLKKQISL